MKNLFEAARVEEVKARLARLQPDSERQWGKMSPAQTLAHCSAAIDMAMGKTPPAPRIFIGRLLGPLAKKRSEEHTSELQSRQYLVCRLLLEKKKKTENRAKSLTGRTGSVMLGS